MQSKWLVVVAVLVLTLSSIACDDSDGLVENMKDVSTGGQEALEELDNWEPPVPESPPTDEEIKEAVDNALDAVADTAETIGENSGLEAAADGAVLTACVVGCDAMYGPLAVQFSDSNVFDACVANCSQ